MERKELMKNDEMNITWLKDVRKTVSEGKMQLPADGWDRVSSTLSSTDSFTATSRNTTKRKGDSPRYLWIYSSAAALMALILAVTLWMENPTKDEESAIKTESIVTSVDIHQAQTTIEENDVIDKNLVNKKKIRLYTTTATSDSIKAMELVVDNTVLVTVEPATTSEKDLVASKSFVNKKDTIEIPATHLENKEEHMLLLAMSKANNFDKKTKISLSFHSGMNRFNNDVLNNSIGIAQPGIGPGEFSYPVLFNKPENKEPQHNVSRLRKNKAWSFGVLLRLMQNARFAYESGIVFTQLSSDAICNNGSIKNNSEKQTLNYLGAPLRISYSLYNSPRWQLYISTGIMAEHCINAKIGMHNFSINNWQWSVNGAFGGQYNFTRTIGIYIEPGVNYYFDDHSGVKSIRTENPFNLNVNMGIRFSK